MELNIDILKMNNKEIELIMKETLEKIKNTSLYKNLKTGRVYKLTDKYNKTIYVLYCNPEIRNSGVIQGYPLTKNFKFYQGRRGYFQNFWLHEFKFIEEVEDNLIREEIEGNLIISDGEDKIKIDL